MVGVCVRVRVLDTGGEVRAQAWRQQGWLAEGRRLGWGLAQRPSRRRASRARAAAVAAG
jgi:hypothetical protein